MQKKNQRSSLLFGGQNLFNSLPRQLFFVQEDFEEQDEFIPFFQIILVHFILLFKIVLGKTASAARNLINSSPQTEATTFALSSAFILLLWSDHTAVFSFRFAKKLTLLNSQRKLSQTDADSQIYAQIQLTEHCPCLVTLFLKG